jgi:hypothetical protein
MVDALEGAAVIFDEFGDVVLYNRAAEAFAGASYVDPTIDRDALPFRRAVLGESVFEATVLLAVPGRDKPIELIATMHPVSNPVDRIVAVLGVLQPSLSRARATVRRAAEVFMDAAACEPATKVLVFDSERRVVAATSENDTQRRSLWDRALRGEVCRVPRSLGCATEMRSGPIRDSLGFIVGGLVVAYDM